MSEAKTQWHGDGDESKALLEAVTHNCECQFGAFGVRNKTCAPHQAMVDDQRFLDGLLMMRHMRDQLLAQEFTELEAA